MLTLLSPETALWGSMIIPILGLFGIMITGAIPNLRETVMMVTGFVTLLCTLTVFVATGNDVAIEASLVTILPGLDIAFKVERLGAMFALLGSGLWIVNSFYAIGYMRGTNEKHQTRFYMCFAIAIMAVMGVAYAANLLTLFIFYEVLTVSTFPLVAHKRNEAARHGAKIYAGILMGTSIGLFLPAVIWTYYLTGTTDFNLGGILATNVEETGLVVPILLGLFAFGIGKAALMPIHSWLPNAMVAPTPVSAFLHAVAVVKAGVFSVLKVVLYIFGTDFLFSSGAAEIFIWLAAFSILCASAIAMTQDNLKSRLAYSTVSQLGYVTLGAFLATDWGVMGSGMQIVMHAFGKMTLFMCAGAIYVIAHKTNISDMIGLGRRMPVTFVLFFIGAMSIIGLPPMGGSWPKFFLMIGALDADKILLLLVLGVSSVLNVLYLLPVAIKAFYLSRQINDNDKNRGAVHSQTPVVKWTSEMRAMPLSHYYCLAPPMFTAAGCVYFFFNGDALYQYLLPIMGGQ